MTTQKDLHIIVAWLSEIANATTTTPGEDMKAKLLSRAKSLAADFPDIRAFTWDSAKFVSDRHDFFPSTMLICQTLSEWWRRHEPVPLSIADASSGGRPLSAIEGITVEIWHKYRAGGKIPGGHVLRWLCMIRDKIKPAYLFLIRTDEIVQGIAREQGWQDDQRRSEPLMEAELAEVKRARDEAVAAIRAGAPAPYVPPASSRFADPPPPREPAPPPAPESEVPDSMPEQDKARTEPVAAEQDTNPAPEPSTPANDAGPPRPTPAAARAAAALMRQPMMRRLPWEDDEEDVA